MCSANDFVISPGYVINKNNPCFVIAEIGQNHQGDIQIAKQLIDASKAAGANCVKFQKSCLTEKFNVAALNRPYTGQHSWGKTYGEHKKYLEFSIEDFKELQSYARNIGIIFSASAMDCVSVDVLHDMDVPFLKIGSGDTNNFPLLEYAATKNRPMVISTGMQDLETVRAVYTLMKQMNAKFSLLHCVSSYPVPVEQINLEVINLYKSEFPDIQIGYSGHELGTMVSVAAVAMGARPVPSTSSSQIKDNVVRRESDGFAGPVSSEPIEHMGDELQCLFHVKQVAQQFYTRECKRSTEKSNTNSYVASIFRTNSSGYPVNFDRILVNGGIDCPLLLEELNFRVSAIRSRNNDAFSMVTSTNNYTANNPISGMTRMIVERHITLDPSWKGTDHKSSLTPVEFSKMVQEIRELEKALGKPEKKRQPSELDCFMKLGKTLVAGKYLKRGVPLQKEDIKIKVADPKGCPAESLNSILGKVLIRDVEEDESIMEDNVV
ncbi:uncharacterized protein GBIM_14849 [Gryllus bimaculatus]|nr:uncharacterized protein GBIM_14849 [Gryllus bimaculatus]